MKKHRKGQVEYHHQLLAVILHPDQKTGLSLDFEPSVRSDSDKKNDGERNAAKRLLLAISQLYSNRPISVLEEALTGNGPHIQALSGCSMYLIINFRPAGNALFSEGMHDRFLLDQVRIKAITTSTTSVTANRIYRAH